MSEKSHHDSPSLIGGQNESNGQEFAAETIDKLLDSCAPHQRALLNVLAVAHVYEMDATLLVSSLADELPGGTRQRLMLLSERMSEGVDFVDALSEIPSLLPPSVILAYQLARENGTLSALNNSLSSRTIENNDIVTSEDGNYFSRYLGLAFQVFIFGSVIVFFSAKVFPEFLLMLSEFGLDAPVALRFVSMILDTLARFWFIWFLAMVVAIGFCIPVIRQFFRRWNPLTWRQPLVSPAVDRRRSLALVTQVGSSLAAGIRTIMGSGKLRRMFGRLGSDNDRIENGEDQWDSLATANIISRREANALTMTASRETQSWLLQWSANNQQTRELTRSAIILRTILALVNIALGLLVALICLAVFSTLLSIMASLS